MGRKTVNVLEIIRGINEVLKTSLQSEDYRRGQIVVAETILHHSGNYHGFRYLLENEVPAGELPGMVMLGTVEDTPPELRFEPGRVDQTRVQFFIY